MKNIYNIINSELIVRTNNVNLKQEYGEVGNSTQITTSGVSTIFTTKLSIKGVNFVTVNGVTLSETEHYTVTSDNTISISNSGSAIKSIPGISTKILVSYFHDNNRGISSSVLVPPTIKTFYADKYSGRDGSITFDFNIEENSGKNIYWSILKDGDATPIFSGNALSSNNGVVVNPNGSLTSLTTYISQSEYTSRIGEKIPFTFVVIYDLTEDGSRLDEKLMESLEYELLQPETITGSVVATPEVIATTGIVNTNVTYSINAVSSSALDFTWELHETKSSTGTAVVVASGDNNSSLIGNVIGIQSYTDGTRLDIRYELVLTDNVTGNTSVIGNDVIRVDIPTVALIGNAGYLSADIMNYEDPANPGTIIQIGDGSTTAARTAYNSRVPRAIFTKTVDDSYLDSGNYIDATVETFGNTVTSVYFVMEVPDNWGPVTFNQPLGEIQDSAFNVIPLGNGYSAHLYKLAPSSAFNPADYNIKRA